MIPTHIKCVERIPLTVSGKVDRERLAGVEAESLTHQPVMPKSNIEIRLEKIIRRVLDEPDSISMTDNFFDIGGRSLAAVRLAIEIEADFGVHLDVQTIFGLADFSPIAEEIEKAPIDRYRLP